MAINERPPMCGVCFKKFVQISETEWIGVCEHRAGVVAHVGSEKIKKAPKKKVMTTEEYEEFQKTGKKPEEKPKQKNKAN